MTMATRVLFFICFALPLLFTGASADEITDAEMLEKKKGNVDTYTASNGEVFRVGESLTLGTGFRNEAYDFIVQWAVIAAYPLPNTFYGTSVEIKKIYFKKGVVFVNTKKPPNMVYGLKISNLEGALANGEIKSKIMSRKEAIAKLKEAKDLLDLEMMSQEDYKSLRKKLAPIIMGQ